MLKVQTHILEPKTHWKSRDTVLLSSSFAGSDPPWKGEGESADDPLPKEGDTPQRRLPGEFIWGMTLKNEYLVTFSETSIVNWISD